MKKQFGMYYRGPNRLEIICWWGEDDKLSQGDSIFINMTADEFRECFSRLIRTDDPQKAFPTLSSSEQNFFLTGNYDSTPEA